MVGKENGFAEMIGVCVEMLAVRAGTEVTCGAKLGGGDGIVNCSTHLTMKLLKSAPQIRVRKQTFT